MGTAESTQLNEEHDAVSHTQMFTVDKKIAAHIANGLK